MTKNNLKTNDELLNKIAEKILNGLDDLSSYEEERALLASEFLKLNYRPKNQIEKALHLKMKEYATDLVANPNQDFTKYDIWMDHFFTFNGLPEDESATKNFGFCRDWYSMKFLDLKIESLVELAESLKPTNTN